MYMYVYICCTCCLLSLYYSIFLLEEEQRRGIGIAAAMLRKGTCIYVHTQCIIDYYYNCTM